MPQHDLAIFEREEVRRQISRRPPPPIALPDFPISELLEGEDEEDDQPRSELKRQLREGDERWHYNRRSFHEYNRVGSPTPAWCPGRAL